MSRQKQSFSIGTEFGSKTVHTSTQIKLTIERKTLNYWNTIEIISWWTKQLDQDRWWGSNFHSLSIRLHLPAKVLRCAFHFREKLSRWFRHDFGICIVKLRELHAIQEHGQDDVDCETFKIFFVASCFSSWLTPTQCTINSL